MSCKCKKGGGGRGQDLSETGANQRNGRRRGRLVVCSVFGEDEFRLLEGEYKFSLGGVGPGSQGKFVNEGDANLQILQEKRF